ncbi:MAG: hypothetical protein HY892_18750 [Deltaproteobacteria bacterium]|nr:hypothetical protein [Deltaproteobacteria bacterium]
MKTLSMLIAVGMCVLWTVISATAQSGGAPDPPSGLTGTALSPTEMRLDWIDNSNDETSFRVERSTNGVSFGPLGSVAADTTSFIDGAVGPDTLYYYRIFAVNQLNGRDSNPSNVISGFTADTISPPAPILQYPPNGDQLDTHNVRFQWNSVYDMSGATYTIVVDDIANGITLHNVSGITGNSIDLLLYDSNYSWTVTATDGAGNVGSASETSYCLVAATDYAPPDATLTAPNGGEELESGSYFPITWYALDGITSTPDLTVQILFSQDNGESWSSIGSLSNNPGAYSWHVPNTSCDATCLIRVILGNEKGLFGSDDSDFAFSITQPTPTPLFRVFLPLYIPDPSGH